MKFNNKALAMSFGLVWALVVFLGTIWVVIKGGGNTFGLLDKFYFGYSVSWLGAFIGLIWGFINGYIIGWLLAWFYNRFEK